MLPSHPTQRAAIDLAGRLLLASLFIVSALQKAQHFQDVAGWMASMGVSGDLLPFVIGLELLGGLAVAVGFHTQLAAICLGVFSCVAAAIFHRDFGDETQFLMFMKNLVIAGGFFVLAANGPARFSVDAIRARRTP